jgi:aminocarboxymuconate-semialdehyde decarboxylase
MAGWVDRVIDIHCHVLAPQAEELTRSAFTPDKDPFFRYAGPSSAAYNAAHFSEIVPQLTDPEIRLRDMDRMGVDIQAISIAPPQYYYWAEPDLGAQAARIENDRLAEIVAGRPDRFVGLGTLPMQDVDRALRELEHVVELGFPGLEICASVNGVDYDDPRFLPFFEEVVARDLALVIHPNGFSDGERLASYYLINTVGMPLDSTLFVSKMIFGGVLERFPDLRICIVHGGGYIPSYPARFDHAWAARDDCRELISRPPSTYLARLFFDTMLFDPLDLGFLIRRWGADHVLLGTDYPYDMGEEDPVGLVSRVEGISDQDRALIVGGNAARLLRLDR